MARTNLARRAPPIHTHEGARAVQTSAINQLRRSVLSCLLWEDEFYEDGTSIAKRIKDLCAKVTVHELASLAAEARNKHHLRHVPLALLVNLVARRSSPSLTAFTIYATISRVDELTELLALYLAANPKPGPKSKRSAGSISHALRLGLDKAVRKFDAYQFAKYDNDKGKAVKLRDVFRIARPKPDNEAQAALFKAVLKGTLERPDTWEVAAMEGRLGKDGWERLLREGRLGYLALLRNLRNMIKVDVSPVLIETAIIARQGGAHHVWPFRYVAAARAAPRFEPALDQALIEAVQQMPQLAGDTIVLVDVSQSMSAPLSGKSDMTRMDAAATLASIFPGRRRVFTFSNDVVEVPPRTGMAGVDAIIRSQRHSGTNLGLAIARVNQFRHDRLVVITDEQSTDRVGAPAAEKAYVINVASFANGIGYGRWVHIDGFSESVLRFIREYEDAESRAAAPSRD